MITSAMSGDIFALSILYTSFSFGYSNENIVRYIQNVTHGTM